MVAMPSAVHKVGKVPGALSYRIWLRRWYAGQRGAAEHVLRTYGDVVCGGPFTGMRFGPPPAKDLCLAPKLLGHYEAELQPALADLLGRSWRTVIDVGCAAGYYTTGLALRCPEATVYGFDLDPTLQALARQAAAANDLTDRVVIGAACTKERLAELCGPDTFLVVDIEGAEDELLDITAVPSLAQTTVLIEVHDFAVPHLSSRLGKAFLPTHTVEVIHAAAPPPASTPEAQAVPARWRRWALDEGRPDGMRWFILRPRTTS